MTSLSVLDLAPIVRGGTAAEAFAHSVDLARHAERWGYTRFWLAEHHGMPGIASAATAVLIGHVAGATSTIRVGAGGIMLPNHAPLVIAEQFGTLATLYPGRIDLGLGRAPGSDMQTTTALRRNLSTDPDDFARDVVELMGYFDGDSRQVAAVPGAGVEVPVWILGSSLFGAQVAATLGLPYAFASHFAPAQMMDAIAVYRDRFRPSAHHKEPYVMLGYNVIAAETDDEARYLASSLQQAFIALRRGRPSTLPPPVRDYERQLDLQDRALLDSVLAGAAIGSAQTVHATMRSFVERTGADELMISSMTFDHEARLHSYKTAADGWA